MKRLFYKLKKPGIIRKLTLRLLLVELAILLSVVMLSQFLLLPKLNEKAINDAAGSMEALTAQMEGQINHYVNYSQTIIYANAVQDALASYFNEPTEQNYHLLALALSDQINSSLSIRGLALHTEEGPLFHSVVNLREADYAQTESEWYQKMLEGSGTRHFSHIYDPGLESPSDSLAYTRAYYIGTKLHVLTLFFKCTDLITIVDTALSGFDGLLITDYENGEVYSQGNIQDSYAVLEKSSSLTYEQTEEGHYFFALLPACSWRVVGYVSNATLMQDYTNIFSICIFIGIILCILTLATVIPIMRYTVRPIHGLYETMQQVSTGDMTVTASETGNDEIADLGRIFNQMLANLNQQMEKQIAFETNEQKMRYNLLLAQIDTHFIGNTMSTINSLSRQGRNSDVIALNTALLKIIQNNLRIRDLDITDTVAQEMEVVENYWLISKIRQGNHATLTWCVPDSLLESCIPKNVIQPLVENSLVHGLIDEDTGEITGNITISMQAMGDEIEICVQDNGRGISPSMLDYLNKPGETLDYLRERGRHIGIANIQQRLFYLYHKNCLHITCNEGTTVILTIPQYHE